MLNVDFHISREPMKVKFLGDVLHVEVGYNQQISLYASPEQLQEIVNTINGHLEYLADVKVSEDQLELHFEHRQVLDKVAV